MRGEILARKGVDVKHVVMTSDEKDVGWWDEVRAQGWYRIDLAAVRAEEGAGSEWYALSPFLVHFETVDDVPCGCGTGSQCSSMRWSNLAVWDL